MNPGIILRRRIRSKALRILVRNTLSDISAVMEISLAVKIPFGMGISAAMKFHLELNFSSN